MKTKILSFACVLLAGMTLYNGTSAVMAEENTATESAIEIELKEQNNGAEITSKVEANSTAVESKEKLEVSDDKAPAGKAKDIKLTAGKNKVKKAEKKISKAEKKKAKSAKSVKAAKVEKKTESVIKYTDEEFRILVCVTFLEAGNQSYKGKLATANSIINRVKSKKFPSSIKGVIYQKFAGRYQFTLCAPGGKLDQAMATYGRKTGWRGDYERACIKVCKDALAGKTSTDRKYHFFRLYYKGIENWKSDGVKIDDTYYYNW